MDIEILRVLFVVSSLSYFKNQGRIEDAYHSHCSPALSQYSYAVGQLKKCVVNNY